MATTVVVNARFYWILDTGGDWNEHRVSLSKAEFRQFVRRYPIEATPSLFPPISTSCPSRPFLGQSCDAAVPFVGHYAAVANLEP
jgi:hypothetical protein